MTPLEKKVLQELTLNSRQSYKQIAKNIGSKKDSVAYAIKKLEQTGIIQKYVPVFSLNKLGLFTVKIYLNLKALNKSSEEKLISWLKSLDDVVWVAKSVGSWNLMLGFILSSLHEFANLKRLILHRLSNFISDYKISFIEDGIAFDRQYLFSKNSQRTEFLYGGDLSITKLSSLELSLISLIRNDGRFEYSVIASKLGVDARTIKRTIDGLKRKGVLQGFTVFLDINKIGFQLHKLCIYFNKFDSSSEEKVISYLKKNPYMIHLIKCVGDWELEVEIELDNIIEVHNYIAQLRNNLYEEIKQINLVTITSEEKLDFFPDYTR